MTLLAVIAETADALKFPSLVGLPNGAGAVYVQSCGIDYSSPIVFVPLFTAFASGVWAVLNIEKLLRERKKSKK